MKGMYVKSEITEIMRHRNRHDLASRELGVGTTYYETNGALTMFNLRIIQRNRLFRVRATDPACLGNAPERSDPPDREENEPNEEAPSMNRRSIFVLRSKPQYPRCRLHTWGTAGIPHVVRARPTQRGWMSREDGADGDG